MANRRAACVLTILSLAPSGDAAAFLGPRRTSLVGEALAHDKEMPITEHDKTAGDGYNPGSPLYEKQQARGGVAAPPPPQEPTSIPGVDPAVTVPPTDHDELLEWLNTLNTPQGQEQHVKYGFGSFFSYFCGTLLTALIWVKCIGREPRGYDMKLSTAEGFMYGLFSPDHCCGHHANVCFCSWCCAPLRLADTYSKEPQPLLRSFWVALVLVTCLLGLSELTLGLTGFIFLCVAVYFRQQLRKQYGMQTGGSTCFLDCLVWWCCPCCAMAQEARQVEFVAPSGAAVSKPPPTINTVSFSRQ